ncbi:MAG TPA: class I SAM-dependent methyltransferase [Solirubrobacteraceae bacterium]|nr:class I SAM-dependent methyltransferase [Solirubrobacteraceae bacterium]
MTEEHARRQVANSVRRYRSAHRRYERRHPEIFNPREQDRLRRALAAALERTAPAGERPRALDLGCGSGNVTRHLIALGAEVTAADVSPAFLKVVARRFGPAVRTLELNGIDLAGVDDAGFDLVTAYSVLHHVPDYLRLLDEVARVLRPGGAAYLDHEVTEAFWDPASDVNAFRRALREWELTRPGAWNPQRRRWQRYLMPSKYALGLRLLIDPDYLYGSEGDIHVWEHDHVEWSLVRARLEAAGLEVVSVDDHLGFSAEYPEELYETYRARGTADMRTLVAQRTRRSSAQAEPAMRAP